MFDLCVLQAFQIALALSDEVADLEAAGCKVVQVDEPALREGLPLKQLKKAGTSPYPYIHAINYCVYRWAARRTRKSARKTLIPYVSP